MKTNDFYLEFRKEHRIIRDLLFDMITSFVQKNLEQSGLLLQELDKIAGPHFRYEEETLYPALITFYGEPYINKLLTDHDLAIARAFKLKELITKPQHCNDDFTESINHVRALLPHISDCEGLTIMVEKLENAKIELILQAMEKAWNKKVSLLNWAQTERNRKLLSIN